MHITQSMHVPSFVWGSGLTTAVGGLVLGLWAYVVAGMIIYGIGWLLLRWQPTYGRDRHDT